MREQTSFSGFLDKSKKSTHWVEPNHPTPFFRPGIGVLPKEESTRMDTSWGIFWGIGFPQQGPEETSVNQ